MDPETQVAVLNGIPLLVLVAVYVAATVAVGLPLRPPPRAGAAPSLALALLSPCAAVAAAILAVSTFVTGEPLAGNVWVGLAAIVVAAVPGVLLLTRRGDPASAGDRQPVAEERSEALEQQRDAVLGFTRGLAHARTEDEIARLLARTVTDVVGVPFAAVGAVEEDTIRGIQAEQDGHPVEWWPEVRLDRRHEASAMVSAAFEAATLTIYDVDSSPLANRRLAERVGARSAAFVPCLAGDTVLAVVVAVTYDHHAFSRDELALLEELGSEAALALERAAAGTALTRALERERLAAHRQPALLAAVQALAQDLELDAVIERLVREVAALVGAEAADCWLLDRRRGVLSRHAAHGSPRAGGAHIAEGSAADAIAVDRPLLARGEAAAPYAETIVAPIASFGEPRGVLRVWAADQGRFDTEDVDVVETFATFASLAIRNAEALEEGTRQARVQRGFYRIAAALAEPLSLESTLHALAQAASEALGATFAAVLMPSRRGALELAGAESLPPELEAKLSEGIPDQDAPLRAAAEEGRILAAPDVAADERFGDDWRELARAGAYRSLLAIPVPAPLEVEDSGLVLVFFDEPRTFTDDDLELARHVAGAAGGALERGAVFEEERTARGLAQHLARTGARLSTELDPAAVLDEVVEQAPELVGVEACAIHLVNGADLVLTAVTGPETAPLLGARSPTSGWVSGDVLQGGTPLALEDASGDDRLLAADPILRIGYCGYLGVPLTSAEGTLQGVLAVYSQEPKAWRDAEVEALLALAGNASAALSNAELYQRVAIEKERSDAILANVADGIVAVDREGLVVLWNAAAERITGVAMADAVGRAPIELLGRDLREDGDDGEIRNRHVAILRAGDEVWLSVSEAVMRDPAGAVAGRIYAFRDVSTERAVEEMKSEFVSTVSEQLRRPLTSIYGFAETLLRDDVHFAEPERQTFLRYIASESERLTDIVDQLLNAARLDTGDLHVQLAPTDVGTVVEEVVSAVEAETLDGHRFVVDLPAGPVTVAADREKLRLVLANLLQNAVKFSPEGGQVTVVARQRSESVEITVADEGVGIPADAQERIFRKFVRGDQPARRVGAGTGLGLFIVEGLVTAMNGRIWVTSAEGQGSSFTFELPAADASDLTIASQPDAERV